MRRFVKKLHNKLIIATTSLFCLLFLGAAVQNIYLNNQFNSMKKPGDLLSINEKIKFYQNKYKGIDISVVSHNENPLKDEKIELKECIHIFDENNENKIFYRTLDIQVDSDGNIYVSDYGSGEIRKFDKNGDFILAIGNLGQGPEDLPNMFNFFIDKDLIYTFDGMQSRIRIFSTSGLFLKTSVLEYKPYTVVRSFTIDESGNYYLSFWDRKSQSVIHKYSPDGVYLKSFGDPLQFKSIPDYYCESIRKSFACGNLLIDNGRLLYSSCNPYEVHEYTLDGILQKVTFRKNNFMDSNFLEITGVNQRTMHLPALVSSFAKIDNFYVASISQPSNEVLLRGINVDFFTKDMTSIFNINLNGMPIAFRCIAHNTLYGISMNSEGYEIITGYKILINHNN